jgi:hypothetical protein
MPRTFVSLVLAGSMAYGAASVAAHHSLATTYRDEQITIEGVLVTLEYRNPHSYLQVTALDRSGRQRTWAVECGSPQQIRRSLDEGALKPGDRIVVTGHAGHDDGQWRLRLRTIVRPSDGWRWSERAR